MSGRVAKKRIGFEGKMRGKAARWMVLLVATVLGNSMAKAETQVQVELVLALDVSASVDLAEYQLQLGGIAKAFRDPEILDAIEKLGPQGAAIAVVQWGGAQEFKTILPFTHIVTIQDAQAFGFLASRAHRFIGATSTSITTALQYSADLLDNNGFEGGRRVIDVSGDGVDNSGLNLDAARASMTARRIVVNGLAIEKDEANLTRYFEDYVISGPNSFVETATDYDDFARAMKQKLLRELRPDLS
jgi:Protein of unknown function (DUF1194)